MTDAKMTGLKPKNSWAKKLGWLVLIWLASIAALAVISLILKLLMKAAGFHS